MATWRKLCLCLMVVGISGCSTVSYLWQAASGHVSIMSKSEDIDEVLLDEQTPTWLVKQLSYVQAIRDFSIDELGLPDNRSYRVYADIGRPYPVWNVVAAPKDSLHLRTWCFPIAGCISYKGFYSESEAMMLAEKLRREGLDVAVAGVPAYSTLGYTADPILSSFVKYPPGELARLIFHELAHQVVYVKDDTQFNESFATAVEQLGTQAWLGQIGYESLRSEYESFDEKREVFKELLARAKYDLALVYEDPSKNHSERLKAKARVLNGLKSEYEQIKRDRWAGWNGYDRYFETDLNNAKLALVGVYNQYVPAFKVLFARCNAEFPRFYASVSALGELEYDERSRLLELLAKREPLPYGLGCDQAMYVPKGEEEQETISVESSLIDY